MSCSADRPTNWLPSADHCRLSCHNRSSNTVTYQCFTSLCSSLTSSPQSTRVTCIYLYHRISYNNCWKVNFLHTNWHVTSEMCLIFFHFSTFKRLALESHWIVMTGLHAWTALGTPTLRSIISTKYRKMMRLVTARYPKNPLKKSNHCGSESSTLETDTLLVVLATNKKKKPAILMCHY